MHAVRHFEAMPVEKRHQLLNCPQYIRERNHTICNLHYQISLNLLLQNSVDLSEIENKKLFLAVQILLWRVNVLSNESNTYV